MNTLILLVALATLVVASIPVYPIFRDRRIKLRKIRESARFMKQTLQAGSSGYFSLLKEIDNFGFPELRNIFQNNNSRGDIGAAEAVIKELETKLIYRLFL